jgi:hypothetical protein
VFIRALHWSLSLARSFQSIPPHPISRSILILTTHLRLGLPGGLLPSGSPANILYAFFFSSEFITQSLILIWTYNCNFKTNFNERDQVSWDGIRRYSQLRHSRIVHLKMEYLVSVIYTQNNETNNYDVMSVYLSDVNIAPTSSIPFRVLKQITQSLLPKNTRVCHPWSAEKRQDNTGIHLRSNLCTRLRMTEM